MNTKKVCTEKLSFISWSNLVSFGSGSRKSSIRKTMIETFMYKHPCLSMERTRCPEWTMFCDPSIETSWIMEFYDYQMAQ